MLPTQGLGTGGSIPTQGYGSFIGVFDTGGAGVIDVRALPLDERLHKVQPFSLELQGQGVAVVPFDVVVTAQGVLVHPFMEDVDGSGIMLVPFELQAQGTGTKRLPRILEEELLLDDD